MIRFVVVLICFVIVLLGCKDEAPESAKNQPDAVQNSSALNPQPPVLTNSVNVPVEVEREPPSPPLKEDFQGDPKISLFPRVGDYKPDPGDKTFGYWRAFIDHLVRITKIVEDSSNGNRAWSFRSIDTIDSLGYFAPVAVKPETDYTVSFELAADLPEGASAGIGIIEFGQFLWFKEQYTEKTYRDYFKNVQEGLRLTGKITDSFSFSFRTGSTTSMVHLVLFRDGAHDRKALIFDNIEIKESSENKVQ